MLEEQVKQAEKERSHWKDEYGALEERKDKELQVNYHDYIVELLWFD